MEAASTVDNINISPIIGNPLTGDKIKERLQKDLWIRPFLEPDKQISELGIDFRLGYDFLVSVQGKEAAINISLNNNSPDYKTNINQFFQPSRRQLGETFLLHPHQTILASSLEYIKLPNNLLLLLIMRSSYSRLGLSISTIVQPGYCGCISLELTNNNRNAINLTVGSRIFQALFFHCDDTAYFNKDRKYMCQVRPAPSAAIKDTDLELLNQLWKIENNRY